MGKLKTSGGAYSQSQKPSFFSGIVNKYIKKPREDVTSFVKIMRALDDRIKPKLIWLSKQEGMKGNTYIKKKHGEIA